MNRHKYMLGFVAKKPEEKDQLPEEIEKGHSWYKLDGRRVVPIIDTLSPAIGETKRRRVFERAGDIVGECSVSTVFLGLNHAFGDNEIPILFETMIFGGEHDQSQWRCSCYKDAEIQHQNALKLVKNIQKQ